MSALIGPSDSRAQTWAPKWWVALLVGLGLWIASLATTRLTGNVGLVPTVVLLGSFLVPITAVIWYLDHDVSDILQPRIVINALIVGGVTGVILASLFESWLLTPGWSLFLGVGLIEELVKGLALVGIAWRVSSYRTRDGIVLGATVGFGFAAFESSGYAFVALLGHSGSFTNLVLTQLLRSVLAPVGHGLWTAILGGVLFRVARRGHLRITLGVIGTYLAISLLHASYDSMQGLAAFLTGVTVVGENQVPVYFTLLIAGFIVISAIGVVWLVRLWRRAGRATTPEAIVAPTG